MLVEPEARVYEHIIVKNGVPRIAGTRYKVIHLAIERMAYGWSPEELQYQHPDLSLGQIYAALAYYADHQAELARLIAEDAAEYEHLRTKAENSSLRQKATREETLRISIDERCAYGQVVRTQSGP